MSGVQLLLWQTKAVIRDSPIKGWPIAMVKEVCRLVVTEGALVKKEFQWPVTLMHLQQWILDILAEIWDFDVAAFGLLGESGIGKSPMGR